MVFEEFFKKKKINLAALQEAEGPLFSEFKAHFEQMGEKSFDHSKKYWFNKLRRRFPLPPEVKTEKIHIANPLAEQTITDGLTTPVAPSPKVGFTPKFRAAAVAPKHLEEKPGETTSEEIKPAEAPEGNTAPKPAFKPRFNPGMVKPKPAEGVNTGEEQSGVTPEATKPPAETPVAKPGFKPRFNAAMVKPKAEPEALTDKPETKEETPVTPIEAPAAKPGFKPRFNAAMMKPKPVAEEEVAPAPEATPLQTEAGADKTDQETPVTKPAYKPKFNMKTLPKKPEQE